MCLMFPMFVVLVLSIHIVMCMYLMSMYPKYVYSLRRLIFSRRLILRTAPLN
jgi:hypothetical protein